MYLFYVSLAQPRTAGRKDQGANIMCRVNPMCVYTYTSIYKEREGARGRDIDRYRYRQISSRSAASCWERGPRCAYGGDEL